MAEDRVLTQRRRVASLVVVGKRLGYSLFGVAMVLFFVGFVGDFTDSLVSAIVACLIVGSIILAPAIILGYAVRAAEREDRERAAREEGER